MKYYEVSPLKITHARESVLTYASPDTLPSGTIVAVEVGKHIVPAVVQNPVTKPLFATKTIHARVEQQPLPRPLIALHNWLSSYYATHPALVWRAMLPSGVLKQRRPSSVVPLATHRQQETFILTDEQQQAIKHITKRPTGTHVLHGVTGSGKTAVYRELAKQTIASGRSVILLVPEIALTSQVVADFVPYFENVHVTHSTMTDAARHTLWRSLLYATTPQLVIGPRSALFMPLKNIGLIVIDECHEPAFKQEQAPRYSALRAASILAQHARARLILGSATPNVSDYYLAIQNKRPVVTMLRPARQHTIPPTTTLVDMTKREHFHRSAFLSNPLIDRMERTLADKQQILLFHNRRGSAPITLCESCGWSAACPRCFVPLTLHADMYHLRCHLCNHIEKVPLSCPSCQYATIIHKGIGTKRVASEVARLFPDARIMRFDGDNPEGVDTHYQALYDGTIDIMIGTQVLAKGLDLPHLRCVGVVQADSGLGLPDYQSTERVFQLLAQVTGRVGRNEHPSHVIIQSYQPSHPSITLGLAQDYSAFYTWCLEERRRAHFPPFVHLLRLTAIYKTEAGVIRASRELIEKLRRNLTQQSEIIGPTPCLYERVRETYRWQIIVKSTSRETLVRLLDHVPSQGWQSELDPMNLL